MAERAAAHEGEPTAQERVPHPGGPRWRRPVAFAALALGALSMFVGSLTLWVKRQALDTGNWTNASSELLADEDIRRQLSVYLVDQAFDRVDVTADLRERLPAQLQPLASQFAASLRSGAVNAADGILSRPAVRRTWELANRRAHESLLAAIDGERTDDAGNVVIDLRPFVVELATTLGIRREPPPEAGRLVVMRAERIDSVRTAVKITRGATLFTWLAAGVLFSVGIWLAVGWRRRALIITGWSITLVGLGLLVVRRVGGRIVGDQLAEATQVRASVDSAWEIATTLLRDAGQAIMAIGILLLAGLWLIGPARPAVAVRRVSAAPLRRLGPWVWGLFALVALAMLLVLPIGSGRRVVGTLVFIALTLAILGVARHRSLVENPVAAPGRTDPPEADGAPR